MACLLAVWAMLSVDDAARPVPGTIPAGLSALRCKDAGGGDVGPSNWKEQKGTVLFFAGLECPVANFYLPQIEELSRKYRDKGIGVYSVYAEPEVSAKDVKQHAAEYKLTIPQWLDSNQLLARAYGIRTLSEVLVVGPDGTLIYRGRIDDRYSTDKGKRREEPRTRELVDAIDAVLAGKQPAIREAPAYGCPMPKKRD